MGEVAQADGTDEKLNESFVIQRVYQTFLIFSDVQYVVTCLWLLSMLVWFMLFYLIDIVRGMLEIYYIMIYNDIPMLVIHPHPWYIKMFPNWQDYPSGWARALSAGDANAAHARELMAFAEAGCCFRYRKTGLFGIENGWDMLRRFFWNFPAIPKCQIPSYSLLKYQRCCKMIVFCVLIVSLSHVWKTLGLTPAPLVRLCPKVGIYRIPTSSWYQLVCGLDVSCCESLTGLWAVKIPLGLRMAGYQSVRLLASQWLESTTQATRTGSLVG